jgi:hypothetical protein
MSLRDGMNVRFRGGIQIPAARLNKKYSYLFPLIPLIGSVGSSEYSVSYELAIGFGVVNPTVLNSLEWL